MEPAGNMPASSSAATEGNVGLGSPDGPDEFNLGDYVYLDLLGSAPSEQQDNGIGVAAHDHTETFDGSSEAEAPHELDSDTATYPIAPPIDHPTLPIPINPKTPRHPHPVSGPGLQEQGQETSPPNYGTQANFSATDADVTEQRKHGLADATGHTSSKRQKTTHAKKDILDTVLAPWFDIYPDPPVEWVESMADTINLSKRLEKVTTERVLSWFCTRRHEQSKTASSGASSDPTDSGFSEMTGLGHGQDSQILTTKPTSRQLTREPPCPYEGCAIPQKNLSAWERHRQSHWGIRFGCMCCYAKHNVKNNVCKLCQKSLSVDDPAWTHVIDCITRDERLVQSLGKRTTGWYKDHSKLEEHFANKHPELSSTISTETWKVTIEPSECLECIECLQKFYSLENLTNHFIDIHKMPAGPKNAGRSRSRKKGGRDEGGEGGDGPTGYSSSPTHSHHNPGRGSGNAQEGSTQGHSAGTGNQLSTDAQSTGTDPLRITDRESPSELEVSNGIEAQNNLGLGKIRQSIPFSHLGRGGTSTVDEVWDAQYPNYQQLARKTIPLESKYEAVSHVWREIKILKKLHHHHIITLVGWYENSDSMALLLSPVAKDNLGDFMTRSGQLSGPFSPDTRVVNQMATWMSCISSAVDYMHGQGVTHGDIKPQNILVSGSNIWLADFGTAETEEDKKGGRTSKALWTTPLYCAPETRRESTRGRPADIWSLGCVLLEVCTFMAGSSIQHLRNYHGIGKSEAYCVNFQATKSWIQNLRPKFEKHPKLCSREYLLDVLLLMLILDPKQRVTATKAHGLLTRENFSCDERCSYDPERLAWPYEGVDADSNVCLLGRMSTEETEAQVVEALKVSHEYHLIGNISSIDFMDKT